MRCVQLPLQPRQSLLCLGELALCRVKLLRELGCGNLATAGLRSPHPPPQAQARPLPTSAPIPRRCLAAWVGSVFYTLLCREHCGSSRPLRPCVGDERRAAPGSRWRTTPTREQRLLIEAAHAQPSARAREAGAGGFRAPGTVRKGGLPHEARIDASPPPSSMTLMKQLHAGSTKLA